MHVDNALGEVQSYAGTDVSHSLDVASLIESAEQMRQIILGNARTVVANCYHSLSIVGLRCYSHHTALRSVLDGVGYEIAHHLLHLFRVEPHRQLVGHVDLQSDVFAQCVLGEEGGCVAQQSRHVGMAGMYMGVTLLLFAEVEQFGYEAAQLATVAIYAHQLVARVACTRHFLNERVGETDDYCEWSAYLVRHIEEEAQLRLVLFLDVAYTLFLKLERFCQAYAVAVFAREPPYGCTHTHYIYNISPP